MRRRDFLGVLSGAVAAWPIVALGQQAAMPVIGIIGDVPCNRTNTSPRLSYDSHKHFR
jgi:hypothetical protein